VSADDETTPDVEPTDGVEIDTAPDDKEKDSAVDEIDKAADTADNSSPPGEVSPPSR
jgi:hypothetical protein